MAGVMKNMAHSNPLFIDSKTYSYKYSDYATFTVVQM